MTDYFSNTSDDQFSNELDLEWFDDDLIWDDDDLIWIDTGDQWTFEDTSKVATPAMAPTAGSYLESQTITITTSTGGASIYYTTDGSTPDATDTLYTTPISVFSGTLKAIGIKSGSTDSDIASEAYTVQAAAPVLTPASGEYSSTQTIEITSTTASASIYYTVDGSDPDSGDILYTAPVLIFVGTLKAITIKAGFDDSDVTTETYTIPKVATPVLDPSSGEYLADQTVAITCSTPGSTIYYTTDGSTPTTGSTVYTDPVLIADGMTIKAMAADGVSPESDVASETYTVTQAEQPVFNPAGGTYSINTLITLSSPTSGSTFLYSLDGSYPSVSYTGPIETFTGTLKAITQADGYLDSDVTSDDYIQKEPSEWDEFRDLGAWDFTEQPDKWGYLNNPRWTKDATPQHTPCGHWHKKPKAFTDEEVPFNFPGGRWVAALEQRGTPYIYLYDVTNYAIIKIDTTPNTPEVVDWLLINDGTYILDVGTNVTHPETGPQRGAYCINKESYNKIWYCFRNTSNGNLKVVEVDIDSGLMSVTNTSYHSAIVPGEKFTDACAVDDYAFFSTNKVLCRVLRFDSSHTLLDGDLNIALGGGSTDEAINSMTINPAINEICILYNRHLNYVKCTYMSYSFFISSTYSQQDTGLDSNAAQNFLRYDEKYVSMFRQRINWPANGVAYYHSAWSQSGTRAFIQNLQYMRNYLGGNGIYFYVGQQANSGIHYNVYRIEHQNPSTSSALTSINTEITAYTNRWGQGGSFVGVYNEKTNKSFLLNYYGVTGYNWITSFNQDLSVINDVELNTGIRRTQSWAYPDQNTNDEPMIWAMPGEIYDESNNQ